MKRIISTIIACCFAVCLLAQHINKSEYFFDTDPGVGKATDLSIITDDTVTINSTIPISSLSSGFHKLVIRFRTDSGRWSLNEARPFYVSGPQPGVATMITRGEYFYDTDPGVGKATAVSFTADDSILYNSAIPVSSLSAGFHKLVLRFRDNNNQWSLNEARPFYVMGLPGTPSTQIVSVEYFYDTDPGVGKATAITITADDSVSVVAPLTAAALTPGFHKIGTRFRDDKGGWSLTEARSFYVVPASTTTPATKVVAAEYFFDTDPGVGKATAILGFTQGDSVTIHKIITAASGLLAGTDHNLFVRVKDDNNVWSLNEARTFKICLGKAVAAFTNSTPYNNGVTLTNTSTNAYSYKWLFGDDSTSTATSPSHTYANGGTYKIALIAESPCGNDTAYSTINFNCTTPYAYFYAYPTQLQVSVTNYSYAATKYYWTFGDGSTSTEFAPNHTYYTAGTYNVCLYDSNGCGGATPYCTSVTVTCSNPVAAFTSTGTGLTTNFTSQSTNVGTYHWDFDDGGTSNQANPTHTFNSSGTYNVKLVVVNGCGKDSVTQAMTFVCTDPTSAFIYESDGLIASFQNNSTSATSSHWYFGDGKSSTFNAPAPHKYSTTGTYNVCLVSANGCGKDSICDSVSVCTPPTADFIPSDSAKTTTLVNASLNAQTYYWTFGNGNGSNLVNPVYTYATAGTYNVCLNVTNACGSDKLCKKVQTSCSGLGSPAICLVTVDSVSKNNIIYWDKTPFVNVADSFIVYREVSSGLYKPIGSQPYSAMSMFVDTIRHKYKFPYTDGDPNKGTYRYKIQYKDTCGGYSQLSRYHNTIYVTYTGGGQFQWVNRYSIEGQLSEPVDNYVLVCDSNLSNKWFSIASVAGTQNQVIDNTYATSTAFNTKYPSARWRVQTLWSTVCTPTLKINQAAITKSVSNIKNNLNVSVGINSITNDDKLSVYPNPASDMLTVSLQDNVSSTCSLQLVNLLGENILIQQIQGNITQIRLGGIANGVYYLRVYDYKNNNVIGFRKIVVAK